MVMKASFICLLLIIYMGCFYYTNKHLPIRSTRIFSYCYISMIVLMVFDLITLYTVNHLDSVPELVNLTVHTIYLISINVTVYLYFLYLRSLLENELLIPGILRKIQSVPFIITSVLIAILPLGYVTGTYSNYSMGGKVYALYVSVILYNLTILYYSTRYWRLLNREKRGAIIASVPIFFVVSVINIAMPDLLFTILYVTLTAVGLMLSNENSEKYLDKQTGMFNQYALDIVSSEYIKSKKNAFAIILTISESENMQDMMNWRHYITAMEKLQHYCSKELKRQAYRVGDNGFVILVSSKQNVEKTAEAIVRYGKQSCDNDISIEYSVIALNECTSSDVLMSKIVDTCISAVNKMAKYDFLTGVFNRNMFEKELAKQKDAGIDAYYLLADLNNLKETNDILGHSAGDELLQTAARLLVDTVGESGMVFRQGGDEFAVLWNGTDVRALLKLLENNRMKLNENRMIPLSFAVGYGRLTDKDVLKEADQMMYEDKARIKGKTG